MPKLSANQTGNVDALRTTLSQNNAAYADENAWKKGAPAGMRIFVKPLVDAEAVEAVEVMVASRKVTLYRPKPVPPSEADSGE